MTMQPERYIYSKITNERVRCYPFIQYRGRNFTYFPELAKDPDKRLASIKNFESFEDDVILASPVKTGTHWMHEILSMLLTQQTDYNQGGLLLDQNFEALLDFETAQNIPKPRLFHTHLPFEYLPRKHIENGYKIIQMNRDPRDRLVSLYTFMCGKIGVPDWSWSEFLKIFAFGDGDLYGGWFRYTKEWMNAGIKYPKSIYFVQYEDLKKKPKEIITQMAKFLQVPYADNFITEVADKCSFEKLKVHKVDVSRCLESDGKSTLFRKGKIGDWKNWFTVAQNEEFQALYDKEMAHYELLC